LIGGRRIETRCQVSPWFSEIHAEPVVEPNATLADLVGM